MHLFQLVAVWLFPCAVCATMAPTASATATDGASVEHNSSSSPAFSSGGVKVADPGSSPSASSTTSASSSSLLGTRSSSSSGAGSPEKQGDAAAAAAAAAARTAPKGDAVRRCLRRFARKLKRAGAVADDDEPSNGRRLRKGRSTKPASRRPVVDGTAREREEAVASAIAYCNETRRRGTSPPPPPPSPSLDGWLLDPNEEGTTSAATHCKCKVLQPTPPPPRQDGLLLEIVQGQQGTSSAATHRNESPPLPPRRDVSLLERQQQEAAATSIAVDPRDGRGACEKCGGESSSSSSSSSAAKTAATSQRDLAAGELGVWGSFDELDDVLRITSYFTAKYMNNTFE